MEDSGFEIVGQSGTAEDLLLKVRSYKPDIAIVDIRMPPTQTDEGLRAAKEIREKHSATAVLVLSQYVEEGYALELRRRAQRGSAICSRTGSTIWPTSSRRSSGSPEAALRSIPAWSRSWSAGGAATTRSTS